MQFGSVNSRLNCVLWQTKCANYELIGIATSVVNNMYGWNRFAQPMCIPYHSSETRASETSFNTTHTNWLHKPRSYNYTTLTKCCLFVRLLIFSVELYNTLYSNAIIKIMKGGVESARAVVTPWPQHACALLTAAQLLSISLVLLQCSSALQASALVKDQRLPVRWNLILLNLIKTRRYNVFCCILYPLSSVRSLTFARSKEVKIRKHFEMLNLIKGCYPGREPN